MEVWVHPPVSWQSTSEFVIFSIGPEFLIFRAPSLRFGPSSRLRPESLHSDRLPKARSSLRPQCFTHSRRLFPLLALRVCFAPLPRPGFSFQGFSPQRSRRDSSPALAFLSLAKLACKKRISCSSLLCTAFKALNRAAIRCRQRGD